MKLFCVYSEQFQVLFNRFFAPTLRRVSPELELVADVFQVGGNGDFRSAGFNQAVIYKWKRGLEMLYDNPDQIMLFTDVDMVFHRPLVPAILGVLGDADIAVTPESTGDLRHWGVNVGVLALRCNANVRKFVSRLLNAMILQGQWDQFAFNFLLPRADIKARVLPFEFANGRVPLSANSILYHATCTVPTPGKSSLEIKVEALSKAEQFFAEHPWLPPAATRTAPSVP